MKIRPIVTHQVVEGDLRASMGWWQCNGPGNLSVSYPMSEWEEVVREDSPQS